MLLREETSVRSIKNEFYPSDVEYDMGLNRALLKLIGVWPSDSRQTTRDKIVSRLAQIISTFLLIFLFIPHGLHIFLVEKNYASRLRMIGAWSFCAMAIMKYAIVITRLEGIKYCIDRIAMDWRNVDGQKNRKIMMEKADACRLFTKICVIFMFSGSMFYSTVLPLVSSTRSPSSTVIDNLTATRTLPYPSKFFVFDAQISPMYEIVFVGHTASIAVLCTVASGVCTLAVKFAMHVYTQYEIVISLLECIEIHENCNALWAKKQLDSVVQRHLHVLTFVPRVESVLNEVCLVELVGSTLNICFVGYYLIKEWENSEPLGIITYVVLMMSFVSNIFIFCYIGQLLTEQSRKIGSAVYMIDWWHLPERQARSIVMLIIASNFPVNFTAGKMVKLSLDSFCSVIKAAVTYLNVLRSTMS